VPGRKPTQNIRQFLKRLKWEGPAAPFGTAKTVVSNVNVRCLAASTRRLTMFSSTNVEQRPKTMATKVVTTTVKLVEAALQSA